MIWDAKKGLPLNHEDDARFTSASKTIRVVSGDGDVNPNPECAPKHLMDEAAAMLRGELNIWRSAVAMFRHQAVHMNVTTLASVMTDALAPRYPACRSPSMNVTWANANLSVVKAAPSVQLDIAMAFDVQLCVSTVPAGKQVPQSKHAAECHSLPSASLQALTLMLPVERGWFMVFLFWGWPTDDLTLATEPLSLFGDPGGQQAKQSAVPDTVPMFSVLSM